jgi:hypothetical protein
MPPHGFFRQMFSCYFSTGPLTRPKNAGTAGKCKLVSGSCFRQWIIQWHLYQGLSTISASGSLGLEVKFQSIIFQFQFNFCLRPRVIVLYKHGTMQSCFTSNSYYCPHENRKKVVNTSLRHFLLVFGNYELYFAYPLQLINRTPYRDDVWWSGGIAPPFFTSAPDGGECPAPCPSPLSTAVVKKGGDILPLVHTSSSRGP